MRRRPRSPLTPAEVVAITKAHADGVPMAVITATYNVSPSTVWDRVRAGSDVALTGGAWVINRRTRVLEYVADCDREAS